MVTNNSAAKVWIKPEIRALGTLSDVAGDATSGNELTGCSPHKNGTVICTGS